LRKTADWVFTTNSIPNDAAEVDIIPLLKKAVEDPAAPAPQQ
jgi:hypothetical protein